MTTEEKNELLMQAEYHRGMADAFMQAGSILKNNDECNTLHNLAITHIFKSKFILAKLQD